MRKFTQMRFVTENFEMLQGLRMVPFGFWFLIMAVGDLAQIPALKQGRLDYPLLLFIVVGGLYWSIGVYYARTYGRVKQRAKSVGQKLLAGWPLFLFVVGVAIDVLLKLPVSFLAIALSFYFFVPFIKALPLWRIHYALIGLVMLCLSLMPLFVTGSLKLAFFAPSGAYFLLGMGLALIVAGILDHFWLRSMMQPEKRTA